MSATAGPTDVPTRRTSQTLTLVPMPPTHSSCAVLIARYISVLLFFNQLLQTASSGSSSDGGVWECSLTI